MLERFAAWALEESMLTASLRQTARSNQLVLVDALVEYGSELRRRADRGSNCSSRLAGKFWTLKMRLLLFATFMTWSRSAAALAAERLAERLRVPRGPGRVVSVVSAIEERRGRILALEAFHRWKYSARKEKASSSPSRSPVITRVRSPVLRPAYQIIEPISSPPPVVQATRCPACGNVYMTDSVYCRKCGRKRDILSPDLSRPFSVTLPATLPTTAPPPPPMPVRAGAPGSPVSAALPVEVSSPHAGARPSPGYEYYHGLLSALLLSWCKIKWAGRRPSMSICSTCHVVLLSGKSTPVRVGADTTLKEVQSRAEAALQTGISKLVNSAGVTLSRASTVAEAGLRDGDLLNAVARWPEIASTAPAFALRRADGSVVTWGHKDGGGDSSKVQDQLRNVQEIRGTAGAFAAIRSDGSVVTWGGQEFGGDSTKIQHQLRHVLALQSSCAAFAALRMDGSVVCWGADDVGGDCSRVQKKLKNVRQIQASTAAFAALLADGSVVTWGAPDCGGDSDAAQDRLRNVKSIISSGYAFAAICQDESVVTWGNVADGGDSRAVQHKLKSVKGIAATDSAFAALLGDGSVVAWGAGGSGGDSRSAQSRLKDVRSIRGSAAAFAAILGDESVVTWGCRNCGGDSSAVQHQLTNVKQIQSNDSAFAAIRGDGSVITWGSRRHGSDSSAVQHRLRQVQQIQASTEAFAALLSDGSVVSWGTGDYGGDSLAVQGKLRGVQHIQENGFAFAALLEDGSVVTWGDPENGGDSSAVRKQLSLTAWDMQTQPPKKRRRIVGKQPATSRLSRDALQ
eukprot:s4452_g8.t1